MNIITEWKEASDRRGVSLTYPEYHNQIEGIVNLSLADLDISVKRCRIMTKED